MHQSRVVWAALFAGASLLGACTDGGDEIPTEELSTASELPVSLEQGLDAEERAFLTLINDHRAAAGAPPLQVSVTLSRAADLHSVDMANNNYFDHTSLDGKSPFTRMCDAGYCFNTAKGENIAAGNAAASGTFTQWKNSEGHNRNMLDPNFRVIGIGRALNSSSQFRAYWTTTFGGQVDEVMTSGGASTTPPPSGDPPPSDNPPPSGGAAEAEPNDSHTTPNPVDGTISGNLTAADQDWFSWSVATSGVSYQVQLTAQGDAQIRMWKLVNGAFRQVRNTSPTSFVNTSNGAGQYVVAVFSPSAQQQSYSLAVQK